MNTEEIKNIFPEKNNLPENVIIPYIEQNEYLINGKIRIWKGDKQEVFSPICLTENNETKQVKLGHYPLFDRETALEAMNAAVSAYNSGKGEWPTLTVEERIKYLMQFIFRMNEKREEVVNMLMWEICKSRKDAEKEFDRTIEYMKDTIEACKTLDRESSRFEIVSGIIGQIRRAPYGVVLCMGPFNYPLNETFTTLIPALLMGNTIVFKPAKYGVLLLQPLLEAFQKSFPPGVVNTVYGDGRVIIGPIMETGKIDFLAFIGSSKVANIIEKQHPKLNRLHTVYGLEAKNPALVLEDAEIEIAVKECVLGSLSYNGQRCTALKLIFVHESIADDFVKRFAGTVKSMIAGMPWDKDVAITPLPEQGKTAWLKELMEDALSGGAEIVNENGGTINNTFFYPAVMFPVTQNMRLFKEEQFGPIVPIVPFKDIEEPLGYIRNSNYGQQASIFSRNPDSVAKLIDPLINQVSRVNINSQCQRGPDVFPFTGRKDSAIGTLSVNDALRVFSIRTIVAGKEHDLNKEIIRDIIRNNKSKFLSTDFIL